MLIGLDLAGRDVLVVGGGSVAARRARAAIDEGARVRVVAPQAHEEVAVLAAAGSLVWEQRPVVESDLEGTWLVHACTGTVDAEIAGWAQTRRVFCVVASAAELGSARTPAVVTAGGVSLGVLSVDAADPARAATVRDQLADQVLHGRVDLRPSRSVSTADVLAPGEVVLLGGGPGDPALMTVRARTLLAQADVVITDRLGPTGVLTELREDVLVIPVGKALGAHKATQVEIHDLLIEHAGAGRRVARLKGGDPFLFGRGGEEVLACRAAGIPVRVVPGVTSAVAAADVAGIPVTHRGTADRLHVVNGHGRFTDLDLAAMRDPAVTVAILMGMAGLARLVSQLTDAGIDRMLPAAVVASATTDQERVIHAPLGELVARCAAAGVGSPAVVLLGQVTREGFLDPTHPGRAVEAPSRRRGVDA
ncbi:uroporphyrinogen-III C-methyltransferase [Cellulomonas sp. NPDC089187]|uniref:uroporphyrinogen-III C-methyltransferase n=1 Tax=Cellulomonas sp. NPDC089187 TaxID=3154970 RepID=UPI003420FBA2